MRHFLIRDLMLYLDRDGVLGVDHCNKELADRIEKLPLPLDLKRTFQWNWATKYADLGRYRFKRVDQVFSGEYFEQLLAAQMIEIGTAHDGSNLVVRFTSEDCEVGLLDGDNLAGEEFAAPANYYVMVCGSLDELLFRLAENRFLPIDYCSASDLRDLKKTMPEAEPVVSKVAPKKL